MTRHTTHVFTPDFLTGDSSCSTDIDGARALDIGRIYEMYKAEGFYARPESEPVTAEWLQATFGTRFIEYTAETVLEAVLAAAASQQTPHIILHTGAGESDYAWRAALHAVGVSAVTVIGGTL